MYQIWTSVISELFCLDFRHIGCLKSVQKSLNFRHLTRVLISDTLWTKIWLKKELLKIKQSGVWASPIFERPDFGHPLHSKQNFAWKFRSDWILRESPRRVRRPWWIASTLFFNTSTLTLWRHLRHSWLTWSSSRALRWEQKVQRFTSSRPWPISVLWICNRYYKQPVTIANGQCKTFTSLWFGR